MAKVGDAADAYRQANPREESEAQARRRKRIADTVANVRISLEPGRVFEDMDEVRAAVMDSATRGLDRELAQAALREQRERAGK